MYLRKSAVLKYLVLAPFALVVYSEWFVYVIQPLFWEDLNCSYEDKSCVRVLFIADPQIQGDLAVPAPLNYLFNWDSDRYLRSTFSVVLRQFRPDVLVYLGDLMDEGSISTMPQFHSYVKRLMNIFDTYYPIMQVWLPGDNDIGGENERVRGDKIQEFEKVFQQAPTVAVHNISFYKVNAITHNIPVMLDEAIEANYKVVLSHYPISKYMYGRKVEESIRPNIYFCGHDHESKYVKMSKEFSSKQMYPYNYGAPVLKIQTNDDWLYEIFVPTCSYRMGTSKMGYGAAVFENNNLNVRYTVFWSPQRFPYLVAYLLVSIVLVVFALIYGGGRLLGRVRLDKRGEHAVPLLQRI